MIMHAYHPFEGNVSVLKLGVMRKSGKQGNDGDKINVHKK